MFKYVIKRLALMILTFLAIITICLTNLVVPILPYLLAFAAGAMIYVVAQELIPESQTNNRKSLISICTLIGFAIMMILDVALG